MKNLLQQEILNNSIQLYLYVFGVILFAFFVKRVISKYFARLILRVFSKIDTSFYRQPFLDLVIKPLEWFFMLNIIFIALDKLTFPRILDFTIYRVSTKDILDSISKAALTIVFIRLCIKVMQFIALILEQRANQTSDQADNQLVIFFKDFFRVILIILGILLILKFSFHYDINNLLTGLSIVGAAIALSLRESLENLIASFVIFFDKPFMVGDTVKVQNFTGTVEKIGLRSTRIRTEQKTFITVPNKQMVDTILDNITLRRQRRVDVRLEVDLAASPEQLNTLINAIKALLKKDVIEASTVFLSDTGKNAHIITIEYYTSMHQTIAEFNTLREEINMQIINLLKQSKIELAAANTRISIEGGSEVVNGQ
ncbi:mechanosensitive ion channel [Danxiaibacter flavus]|uniref:Mechanosensitive ion channel n=1 Tax=Danxiaibacter flavus TaxID=3049108 RepID=A0ABV3ZFH7_9BACT|nr:mechanosensitive ion channel [Chitinophagaceae bacterium DXS]